MLRHADFIGSTKAIIEHCVASPKKAFIVATEAGIIHTMRKAAPDKEYFPAPPNNGCACNECPHMKLNTLEKLYLCMKNRGPEISMPEDLREAALKPLQLMLEWS